MPQIEVMSCGQAEKQITRSISARDESGASILITGPQTSRPQASKIQIGILSLEFPDIGILSLEFPEFPDVEDDG